MLLRVAGVATALGEWLSRAAILALTLAVGAALLWSARRWRRWHDLRWVRERANLRRLEWGLSYREWQVLQLLADPALTYGAIGARLGIDTETVRTHSRRIRTKLGAGNREAVVAVAREHGLLPPPMPPSPDDLGHPASDDGD
jgi:DNA-binding CsgD family transcriptional regulator